MFFARAAIWFSSVGRAGQCRHFDLIQLSRKGSLFLTRPTLVNYIATHEELQQRAIGCLADDFVGKIEIAN